MDFSYTEDQRMLRDSVRKALADLPVARAREGAIDPSVGADAWEFAVGLGWPAIVVPEHAGGLGLGPVEAAIVAEEMGKALYAGSYRDGAVLLPALLERASEPPLGLYEALNEGRMHVTLALHEEGCDWLGATTCRLDQGRLHGKKTLVEHGLAATHILVVLRVVGGMTAVLVPASDATVQTCPRQSLDATCGLADIAFDGTKVLMEVHIGEEDELPDVFDGARLFTCAEMLGVAGQALDMTLAYARERRQFGQPIGSFQAVKHRLADAFVQLENARTATYYAAMALQDGLPDVRFAVDAAQAACGHMAVQVTSACIQVHGGIGFTWEYDLHLYFKRARRLATFLGGSQYAYRRIGRNLA